MINYDRIDLSYDGIELFKQFKLKIVEGEKVLISGPSGCGKTSLFRLLLGFSGVEKGDIYFKNQLLDKNSIRKIRSEIFYLSQDIDLRDEEVDTVIREILEYDLNKKINYDGPYIKKYMDILELEANILNKNVMKLSGGERQRVGLLICFLLNRPVLLLDEPTSALDEKMKMKIADMLLKENKTVLIISHDEVFQKNELFKRVEIG